jgi:hypothetical protein
MLILAIVIVLMWAFGWFAFQAVGGLIHVLLIVAIVAVILHFVRGGRVRG